MGQDLTPEFEKIQTTINVLSNKIDTNFNRLNDNLSKNFNQINQQITHLYSSKYLSNESVDINLANNDKSIFQKTQEKSAIPDEYFIDYSYIDSFRYPEWFQNLEKENKNMAECRHHKQQIYNFCTSAHRTIESSIQWLFNIEFEYMDGQDESFLKAYDRVKNFVDTTKKYEFPNIYVSNTGKIDAEGFKKIGNNYIDWKKLEDIYKMNFPMSVRILFEIIKPNFYNTSVYPHLKTNYLRIIAINDIRKIPSHGSMKSDTERINNLYRNTKELLDSKEKFSQIQDVVSWFVKEVYNRLNKISNRNQ